MSSMNRWLKVVLLGGLGLDSARWFQTVPPALRNPLAVGSSCCAFPLLGFPWDVELMLPFPAPPRDGAVTPGLLPAQLCLSHCTPERCEPSREGSTVWKEMLAGEQCVVAQRQCIEWQNLMWKGGMALCSRSVSWEMNSLQIWELWCNLSAQREQISLEEKAKCSFLLLLGLFSYLLPLYFL